jgi:hypothetical protein
MKYNIIKAKLWMENMAMDHIKDGLFAEGGELLYEAKFGTGCNTEKLFRKSIRLICCWDELDIDNAVKEAME